MLDLLHPVNYLLKWCSNVTANPSPSEYIFPNFISSDPSRTIQLLSSASQHHKSPSQLSFFPIDITSADRLAILFGNIASFDLPPQTMACTQANVPAVLAYSTSSDIYGMQVCKMAELRIKGRKVDMPEPINRNINAQQRTLTFYTTKRKLDLLKPVLSPSDRISHLAETCNLGTLHDNNMDVLTEDYTMGNLHIIPGNFCVVSFHNEAGQVVNNTTTFADPKILKGTGGMDAATATTDRRAANIKFVTVETTIDFTMTTNENKSKFNKGCIFTASSNKLRLVQRWRARRAHTGEHVQSPMCPLYLFCTFLAFALGSRANATVAIPT